MNETDIEHFIEQMVPAAIEAGQFARASQGTVQNLGKEVEFEADTHEYAQRRAKAKTIIDVQVQERLLAIVKRDISFPMRIDAEEDTPAKQELHTENAEITLVIDPIDGTLEYLEGKDNYSICIALVSGGRVLAAIVYFPMHDRLYLLDASRESYVCTCDAAGVVQKDKLVSPNGVVSKKLYFNNRVSEAAIRQLAAQYTTVRDIDKEVIWPEALLGCISGEFLAAFFVRPQIRDVLIGAMIEAMPAGYAVDFGGNKITWPNGGRIPEVVFGFAALPDAIKKSLEN